MTSSQSPRLSLQPSRLLATTNPLLLLLLLILHLPSSHAISPAATRADPLPGTVAVPLPEGTHFEVVVKDTPPFVQVSRDDDGEVLEIGGWSIEFLRELAKEAAFKYSLTPLDDDAPPSQLVDMVQDPTSKFNMSIAALTITAARADQVDFTTPYYDLGLRVVHSPTQKTSSLWQFLVPFGTDVWLLNFLIFCLFVTLYSVYERKYIPARTQHPHHAALLARVALSVYYVAGAVIQAFEGAPNTPEGKILATTALAFFFIMSATYTANLASFLTRVEYTNRIYDVDQTGEITQNDLVNFIKVTAIREKSAIETWFNREVVGKAPSPQQYILCNSYDQCNSLVLSGQADATIYDGPLAKYGLSTRPDYSNLSMIGEPLNLQGYGIAVQKGHDNIVSLLSREILRRRSNGLIEALDEEFFKERMLPDQNDDEDLRAIHIKEVGGVYLVLAIALIFSVCYFLIKYWRTRLRRSQSEKMDQTPPDRIDDKIRSLEISLHDLLNHSESRPRCLDDDKSRRSLLRSVLEASIEANHNSADAQTLEQHLLVPNSINTDLRMDALPTRSGSADDRPELTSVQLTQ